jgi:hypothetical protein
MRIEGVGGRIDKKVCITSESVTVKGHDRNALNVDRIVALLVDSSQASPPDDGSHIVLPHGYEPDGRRMDDHHLIETG